MKLLTFKAFYDFLTRINFVILWLYSMHDNFSKYVMTSCINSLIIMRLFITEYIKLCYLNITILVEEKLIYLSLIILGK